MISKAESNGLEKIMLCAGNIYLICSQGIFCTLSEVEIFDILVTRVVT